MTHSELEEEVKRLKRQKSHKEAKFAKSALHGERKRTEHLHNQSIKRIDQKIRTAERYLNERMHADH